jgi:hypothetical protein
VNSRPKAAPSRQRCHATPAFVPVIEDIPADHVDDDAEEEDEIPVAPRVPRRGRRGITMLLVDKIDFNAVIALCSTTTPMRVPHQG